MVAPHLRRAITAIVVIIAFVGTTSADPVTPNTVTSAPPAVDLLARTISVLTALLSGLTFIWTRIDKARERSAAKATKTPIVGGYLQPTGTDDWVMNYSIRNRGDFILVLDQITASEGFTFSSAGGSSSKIRTFKDERATPQNQIRIGGHVHRQDQGKNTISITFSMTELSAEPGKLEMVVTREL
jgi:hypothetical protein